MSDDKLNVSLYQLARLYNVQTAYYDLHHRRQQASVESLLGVLKALGAPINSVNDVPSALRERRQALRHRVMEPVTVVWNGEKPTITVCLPSNVADISGTAQLELESGESFNWTWSARELPVIESADVEGKRYVTRRITLPESLPWGYHKFVFKVKGNSGETMIISAPRKAYSPPDGAGSRQWGAFLPLYALQTGDGWGSGNYSGLGALADWVAELGGQVVATLPLLPVFLDKPFEPSPYAPVSRLLWNEFYVDITRAPELAACSSARALIQSASFQTEIKAQQEKPMVDYRKLMSLKRQVMTELCRCLVNSPKGRLEEFRRFSQKYPLIEEYARFRAVMEKQNAPWPAWPQRLRDGNIQEGDYDEETRDYYLYAQWLAHQQVQELSENARNKGVKLYFDLPVGVHPVGYDVWRQRNNFALNATVGAPPDAVFTNGQNWGFPPLHPENIREQHYRYVIDYLRHHLRYADMLRIDHVMGLHRLFWIPPGLNANDGVYVRYRAEELYAILSLESHRHRSIIVGEDLGIVPSYVRPAMARHGLNRMYILYYELADNTPDTFSRITPDSVASLNTHDMPPFAAFWQGTDIPEKKSLGLLDAKGARKESKTRRATKAALIKGLQNKNFLQKADTDTRAILKACLAYLSNSPARVVLVNLEDLWLETRSQNVPGTGDKYPSWQRKVRYRLEDFCRMQDVRDILEGISSLRKRGKSPVHKNKRS
jgi:4-alpha-glucanotransferase